MTVILAACVGVSLAVTSFLVVLVGRYARLRHETKERVRRWLGDGRPR